MRVLLLGASGFIGGGLWRYLRAIGVDVLTAGRGRENDIYLDASRPKQHGSDLHKLDFDVAINAIACGLDNRDVAAETAMKVNAGFPVFLAEELSNHRNFPFLVHLGSSLERGSLETDNYVQTKSQGSDSLLMQGDGRSNRIVVVKLPSVYGPFQPANRFVASAIETLLRREHFLVKNPASIRDFVYIEDATRAIAMIAGRCWSGRAEEVIGTGTRISALEAAKCIAVTLDVPESLVQSADVDVGSQPAKAEVSPLPTVLCPTHLAEGLVSTMRKMGSSHP